MDEKETLKDKVKRLWKAAGLPEFFNKYGPKKTPAWLTYLCHLEYAAHAPAWRRARTFMRDYHQTSRHWTTWQKAIQKWPQWVWDALSKASAGDDACDLAAIDGTTVSRSNPSQHYLQRIDGHKRARPVQNVVMIDVKRRKFLAWRTRATPRGEKCDVLYLLQHSPVRPELMLMDKGFDSEPLHARLRCAGVWSIAPVRKKCTKGRYRKQLRDCFDWNLHWQRNLVESLISAVKRLFGTHVRARTARMQRAELNTRFIAYNIGAILHYDFLHSRPVHNPYKPPFMACFSMAIRDCVIENPRLRDATIQVKAVDDDAGMHGIVYMSGMCGLGSRVKALCMRFDVVDEGTTLHNGKDELFFYGSPSVLRANFNRVPDLLFDEGYVACAKNLVVKPLKAMYRGRLTALLDCELRIPFEDMCLGDARKECARELVKTTENAWEEFRKNLRLQKRGDTKRWSSVSVFPCDFREKIDEKKKFYSCVYNKHPREIVDKECGYRTRVIGLPAFMAFSNRNF